jgi:serine/threonine protein kinase
MDAPLQYAIKRLKGKFASWDDVTKEREFCAIRDLCRNLEGSENILRVHEILREKDGSLSFVMEYMQDGTLYQYLEHMFRSQQDNRHRQSPAIPPSKIQSILFQCLRGLEYIHGQGYIHRDVKPENIMMNGETVKLGDFSLSRKVQHGDDGKLPTSTTLATMDNSHQQEDASGEMTTYVATRWYRAPELLRSDPFYSCAVDIFALGCVAAELHLLAPLFQGKDDQEQLQLVTQLLARDVASPLNDQGVALSNVVQRRLAKTVPMAEADTIDLMSRLLEMDSMQRCTTGTALQHAYFQPSRSAVPFALTAVSTLTPNKTGPGQLPFVTVSKAERKQLQQRQLEELEPNRLVRAFLFPDSVRPGKRKARDL